MSTNLLSLMVFPFTTSDDLKWVDYIHLQDYPGPGAEQIRKNHYDAIPIQGMLGEDYYEQENAGPPGKYSDPRYYIRWSFWSWILSGGSYTYGGRWGVIHPHSQTGRTDMVWISPWTKINFTGYPLKGIGSVPYIWSYFRDRKIDLGTFKPNDGLVSSYGRPNGASWHPDLMQRGTNEFLVYHPNAASEGFSARMDISKTAIFKIDLTAATGDYMVEWYRPDDGVAKTVTPFKEAPSAISLLRGDVMTWYCAW